jgi:hypothetical protein
MDVIRQQMALLDPALLPSRQIMKYLAQVPLDLPEQKLLAVLRREHDVVLALPSRVIKMIVLCASIMVSLRVLGGSPRRPHDFIPTAVELPVFAPP